MTSNIPGEQLPNPEKYSAQVSRSRADSFRYALRGIQYVLRYQRNSRLMLTGTLLAIVAGVLSQISNSEWALIAIAIGMVWTLEFVNSAIEATVNLIGDGEYHPMAGIAKDVAAGAVLIGVGTAIVIGILIFGPPLAGKIFPGGT